MKLSSKQLRGVTRWFAAHDDGTVSFAICANKLPGKEIADGMFVVADLDEVVPVELMVGRSRVKPRLLLKVYFKVSQRERERLKWGVMRKLSYPRRRE